MVELCCDGWIADIFVSNAKDRSRDCAMKFETVAEAKRFVFLG